MLLIDNLPATTTLLPMECDTFAVTGTFFLAGGCPVKNNKTNSSLSLEINTSLFDQGLYVVEWIFSGQKPQTKKLTIIR